MREYLTVFLVAAVVTYLLGVVAREVALRTGAMRYGVLVWDKPRRPAGLTGADGRVDR